MIGEEDLPVFEQSPIYVGLVLRYPGTYGQYVAIYEDDFIDINALVYLKVLADIEK